MDTVTGLQRVRGNSETIGDAGSHRRHNPGRDRAVVILDVDENLDVRILPVEFRDDDIHLDVDVVVEAQPVVVVSERRSAHEQSDDERDRFHGQVIDNPQDPGKKNIAYDGKPNR